MDARKLTGRSGNGSDATALAPMTAWFRQRVVNEEICIYSPNKSDCRPFVDNERHQVT